MTREDFKQLFERHVEKAIVAAKKSGAGDIPFAFVVEMHGCGYSGKLLTCDEAVDAMYIGPSTFYRIIDIGFKQVSGSTSVVFVRVSAHSPSGYEDMWNNPEGSGPFKVLSPMDFP